jgi:hypothetical protein
MTTCSHVCRELPLFIGGDLDVLRSAEIGRHLRDCPRCRREAVSLQQPMKRLRRLAVPALGDAWFTSMHAAIVDRLDAEVAAGSTRPWALDGWRSWLAGMAAAALFVVGWCWVGPKTGPAALERPPIAVPVGHSDPTMVVPYAGERVPVPLRLLGDDVMTDRGGAGIMARLRLRSLVDEEQDLGTSVGTVEAVAPPRRADPK